MFYARQEQAVLAVLIGLVLLGTGLVLWQRHAMGQVRAIPVEEAVYLTDSSPDTVRPGHAPGRRAGSGAAAPASAPSGAEVVPGEARRREDVASSAAAMVIHIVGAVRAPGVYIFKEGQRVADAVAAAGGPAPAARPDLINLAERLQDGQKLYVPSEKDARGLAGGAQTWASSSWEGAGSRGQGTTAPPAKVSLNQAGVAALDTLPGIGPALAARIVEYRQTHGPFRRAEDVQQVPGIGPSKFREIRDRLILP